MSDLKFDKDGAFFHKKSNTNPLKPEIISKKSDGARVRKDSRGGWFVFPPERKR